MTELKVSDGKIIIEIESSDPIGELLALQTAFDNFITSQIKREKSGAREGEILDKIISLSQQTEHYCVNQISPDAIRRSRITKF